jgi:hypothetical protein
MIKPVDFSKSLNSFSPFGHSTICAFGLTKGLESIPKRRCNSDLPKDKTISDGAYQLFALTRLVHEAAIILCIARAGAPPTLPMPG